MTKGTLPGGQINEYWPGAGLIIDPVNTVTAVIAVIARTRQHRVIADAAEHRVITIATDQPVIAIAAKQRVIAGAAVQRVIEQAAEQPVIAAKAIDRRILGGRGQHIIARRSGDRIQPGIKDHRMDLAQLVPADQNPAIQGQAE